MTGETTGATISESDIAIIGMAAHLPGAQTIAAYWDNLRAGIESIRQLSTEELLANGESPAKLRAKNYVPASVMLDGFADFDAEFFGFSPKEAAIMDPQHRQFLEVAWEALEDAAHPPEHFPGAIGVFAGCGMGSYFYFNLCSNPDLVQSTGMFLLRHTGNDKDFLSTRVSHVFDLKGPSLNIQTACSTSLVAVHVAAQSLLNGECDMALAGGVTIELPQGRGYLYQDGEILSPDGHCHAFDHRAQGTIFGSGAGCVVLRRLKDAIADGDHIWAVIKGTAVNNDGAAKAGYLAPSVDGQARAIAEAQAVAGVPADTVAYVECHGTGTYLGDPIEVAALTQAFRETTDKVDYARIGSVKTNIGHLDTAAGVASLIKASLALHHKEIPPSLGFEAPNPAIDFDSSPFRVNDRLSPFPALGAPRRAGVNSLGVGGTNAHAVLEEAPLPAESAEADFPFLPIVLSARTGKALDQAAARLAAHLRANPDLPLADLAHTLKEGRRGFEKRRVLVAGSTAEAAALLESPDRYRVFTHSHLGDDPEVVFMFPGGGAQYAGMARDLYETEPVFRTWMERGLAHLQPKLGFDLQALWLPEPGEEAAADTRLKRPSVQLPLIMMVEYALAQLWISWGVRPTALIGHSMGENTAACLAGVLSFEDCIDLVHLRGQLFDSVAPGGMLSVPMAEADLRRELGDSLDMASVNAPGLCVVSGPQAELDALQSRLAAREIEAQRIQIDIAAHSRLLEPILKRFGDHLGRLRLQPPQLPIISNRTGEVLTADDATDPEYWVYHLRGTVLFAEGMKTLSKVANRVYLEVGPGKALSSLAQANGVPANQVLSSLRHPEQRIEDDLYFLTLHARLWALGVPVDWTPIWGEAPRQRLSLPSYPFQRSRYFIEPAQSAAAAPSETPWPERVEEIEGWGWRPQWRPRAAEPELEPEDLARLPAQTWLLFTDAHGVAADLAARLSAAGQRVVTVAAGDRFAKRGETHYQLSPEAGRADYDALLQELAARDLFPDRIAHFWLVTEGESFRPGSSFFHRNMEQGFWSLFHLGQALAEAGRPLHLTAVTTGAAAVKGETLAHPEKATLIGPIGVLPREVPGLTAAQLDIALNARTALTEALLEELLSPPANRQAALRGERRFEKTYRAEPLPEASPAWPQGAAVLITGGFGGIGLSLAERLIRDHGAKIALLGRSALPPREAWDEVLRRDPASATARRIAALRRLEALGGEVLPLAADICNLDEMRAARGSAEAAFGRLHAVIHAAGVVDDAPLLAKSEAAIEAVLAPKISGTQVLEQVFPDGDLALLVLFASTSTATLPAGQVDYVAANAFLNAYAEHRRAGRTKVVALNWGIWADAGMAAEAVLGRPAAPPSPVTAAMFDEVTTTPAGNRLYSAEWDVAKWWLDGHRTASGQALIPGTGYLEMIAEAMAAEGIATPWTVEDLYFLRPLTLSDAAPRKIALELARTDGGATVEIRSELVLNGRRGEEVNAQASLRFDAAPAQALDPAALAARMGAPREGKGMQSPQEAHLRFGPEWRVLDATAFGRNEGLARLSLPEPSRGQLSAHPLHPALLDIATGWAMELITGYRPDHLWVPVGYRRFSCHAPLTAEILSHIRNAAENRADAPFASFDVTLCAPDGRVLVEIEGFQIRRLDAGLTLTPPDPREIRFFEEEGPRPLSPAEERLHHNLANGIPARHGAEAFLRALSTGASPVFVSSMPLPALIAQSEELSRKTPQPSGQSFARPDLDSAYVEPRNEIERRLTGFWQELLGVGQVGVEDSFFDLGGHSLIAVRLFAMIRKSWGVDFPISVLFEAPTIAACAALIEAEIGPQESQDGAAPAPLAPPRARYTHLVAMHPGPAKGAGRPFFVVSGMFGNVLNLRQMAQLIGADRPFYGLQARGLFGDQAPHDDFVEAARDYLAEMRQVQPEGPYLLGGFSGGGLIAWEIARQLEAAGEEVAETVLLDTPLPLRPELSRPDKALIKLQEFRRKGPGYAMEWWRARKEWQELQAAPKAAEGSDQLNNAAVEAAFRAALPRYRLEARTGPVVLFRPALDRHWQVSGGQWVSAAKEYVYPDNQWSPHAPALQVIEVPGDHDSMVLEPNVRVLAGHLRRRLSEAEGPLLRAAAE